MRSLTHLEQWNRLITGNVHSRLQLLVVYESLFQTAISMNDTNDVIHSYYTKNKRYYQL
jgi:hypothetical protein